MGASTKTRASTQTGFLAHCWYRRFGHRLVQMPPSPFRLYHVEITHAKFGMVRKVEEVRPELDLALLSQEANLLSLARVRSTLGKPGPGTIFLPSVPRNPAGGSEKAHGSNQRLGVPNGVPLGITAPSGVVQPGEKPLVMLRRLCPE
jgi:hypothetical protein